ncbi:MAG: ribbon-helix-helix protein, CopG family [Candidatus Thiothrix singaporensis]|uniref:Ribbon-helix-helix protein, CopG family n=1 Tax=Candidatus Thiothrix singaporensis TaxID=2799669 RepID=A0A7L6AXD5_9GAMM|nr:MAG: ribbon-helix-helix protein, CopG family [Candidatus Thiothrix singaporensis]
MSLSIRLDKTLEESLRRRLQAEQISLSDFIRDAIREKLAKDEGKASPYALANTCSAATPAGVMISAPTARLCYGKN